MTRRRTTEGAATATDDGQVTATDRNVRWTSSPNFVVFHPPSPCFVPSSYFFSSVLVVFFSCPSSYSSSSFMSPFPSSVVVIFHPPLSPVPPPFLSFVSLP